MTHSVPEDFEAFDAARADALLVGFDPLDRIAEDMAAIAGFDLPRLLLESAGLNRRRVEAVGLLFRDPLLRAVAEIAHRHGLRYTEVRDSWSDEDLVMEMAITTVLSIEAHDRCPDCGITPAEMRNELGRDLDEPAFMIDWHDCASCAELAEFQDVAKPAEGQERPVHQGYYRYRARAVGDDLANLQPAHRRGSSS